MTALQLEDLPDTLPVFPLPRVLLLPRCNLPLNIFEPRYLAMVDEAFKTGRLIGVIQPQEGAVGDPGAQALRQTGCAGRITAFSETEDGRYLITLTGVCRFDIRGEVATTPAGYRVAKVFWDKYRTDLCEGCGVDVDREEFLSVLEKYLKKNDMICDKWPEIRSIAEEKLICNLSMICPFTAEEKQALLEAPDLKERARILLAILEVSCQDGRAARRH